MSGKWIAVLIRSNHKEIQVGTRPLSYQVHLSSRRFRGRRELHSSRSLFGVDGSIESGLAIIMKRVAGARKREFVHLCQRLKCEDSCEDLEVSFEGEG